MFNVWWKAELVTMRSGVFKSHSLQSCKPYNRTLTEYNIDTPKQQWMLTLPANLVLTPDCICLFIDFGRSRYSFAYLIFKTLFHGNLISVSSPRHPKTKKPIENVYSLNENNCIDYLFKNVLFQLCVCYLFSVYCFVVVHCLELVLSQDFRVSSPTYNIGCLVPLHQSQCNPREL